MGNTGRFAARKLSMGPSCQPSCERPSHELDLAVKKALARPPCSFGCHGEAPPVRIANGLKTEGPSGWWASDFFAEIGRRTTLTLRVQCKCARRRRHRSLPAFLQTGKRAMSVTRGARSDRGRGEVSTGSNPAWGVSRLGVLDPWPCVTSAVAPIERRLSFGARQSSHHFPVVGTFERSVVVLAETFTCRNRRSALGLEGARDSERTKV